MHRRRSAWLLFSIFVNMPLAIYLRNIDVFSYDRYNYGDVRMDATKIFRYFFCPIFILEVIAFMIYFDLRRASLSPKKWTFGAQILATYLVGFFAVELFAFASSVDVYWSGVSILVFLICTAAAAVIFSKHRLKGSQSRRVKSKFKISGKMRLFLKTLLCALNVIIIVPLYLRSGSSARLVIISVVHPIVFHSYLAYARICDILTCPSAHHATALSTKHVKVHAIMSLTRRFMLLNVGGATLSAIVVCSQRTCSYDVSSLVQIKLS